MKKTITDPKVIARRERRKKALLLTGGSVETFQAIQAGETMQIDPFSPTPSKENQGRYLRCIGHPRGFLANYPADVVAVINGVPITKTDILQNKQARQRRQLAFKRRDESIIKPCFVRVFWTDGLGKTGFFMGWYLYVETIRNHWLIKDQEIKLKIMQLFPCGHLPMVENFERWKATFAKVYHRPTLKRADRQGLVPAWAEFTVQGKLLDVRLARLCK